MIYSLEGPMGTGKTLTAAALTYTEYIKQEILKYALEQIVKGVDFKDILSNLCEKFGVSKEVAVSIGAEALKEFELGITEVASKKVISNDHLQFPYIHFDPQYFLTHLQDEELDECILLLDEAYLYLESRASQSRMNKLFTYFIAQTRKRGVDLYVCTQHIDVVDKRLRRAVDIRGTCRYYKEDPCKKCGGSGKDGKNGESCDRCLGWGVTGWATTTLLNRRTGRRNRIRVFGPAFFWLYDTRELLPFSKKQLRIPVEDL